MKNENNKINKLTVAKNKWSKTAEFLIRNSKWLGYSSNIAKRILAALEENENFTQKKLATAIRVSPQYISKVVQGKENLSLETIAKISEAVGVELISFPPYKYSPPVTTQAINFIFEMKAVAFPVEANQSNIEHLQKMFFTNSGAVAFSLEEIGDTILPHLNADINHKTLNNANYSLIKQIPQHAST